MICFFRRYKISDVTSDQQSVIQRRIGNHFISLEAFHFRETLTEEKSSTVGAILPSLTHQYDFAGPIFNGALAMTNSLTHRARDQGVDETRLSSMLDCLASYNARWLCAVGG